MQLLVPLNAVGMNSHQVVFIRLLDCGDANDKDKREHRCDGCNHGHVRDLYSQMSVRMCVCVCACVRARVCACVILPSQPKSTTCFVHCWDYCVQIYRTQFVVKHFAGDIRYETDQCVAAQTVPNVFLHRSLLPLCPHFPFSSPLLSLSLSGFLPPAC